MSASVGGELVIGVVGGVLYLGYLAAKGTVWTAGQLIQGTATIVGDAVRGRRMRMAGQNAAQLAQTAGATADRRAQQRSDSYQRQLTNLGGQQQELLRNVQQQARRQQEQLQQSLRDLQRRQQQHLDRRCQEIEDDLRLAEQKFDDRLNHLASTVDQRFQDERQHLDRQLAAQTTAFQHALIEQRSALQLQIDRLNQRVDNEQAAAEDWLAAAEAEVAFVGPNYRHGFFCPGELATIEQRLSMARQNCEQGLFQAALAVSQECVLQGSLLHQQLELLTQQWETHRLLALESLEVALEALQAHRTFQLSAVQVEGAGSTRAAAPQEVDTDFWTQGQWSALQQQLAELRWRIADEDVAVSLEELAHIQQAGRDAPTQAVALAARAKYALMASVLRVDLQREFCARLAESGYQVVDNVWAGNDERQANHVVLRGVNGDEIAVVIAPKENAGTLSNQFQIHFRDAAPNEAERKEKLEAIYQVLNEVYQLPREAVEARCLPGTDWTTNAAPRAL